MRFIAVKTRIKSAFLTVLLAQTNIYGIVIDPTSASENLLINYPSTTYNNSIFYNNQGYYAGPTNGVIYNSGGPALSGRGIWYSLSTKVATTVSLHASANIRWGWQYTMLCISWVGCC